MRFQVTSNPDHIRVHMVKKNQETIMGFRAVRKRHDILLKLEESQEKVRNFYHSSKFCSAQLWS